MLACSVLLLTGCDPVPTPGGRERASMNVRLDASGGADIQLVAGGDRTRDELLAFGRDVLATVLPDGVAGQPRIGANSGGRPFVRVAVTTAYLPGPHPYIRLDARAAVSALAQRGVTSLAVEVQVPHVASSATWTAKPDGVEAGSWTWTAAAETGGAPAGVIELRPEPARAWFQILLLAAGLGGVLAAAAFIRARRRPWAVTAAAAAILAGVGAIATAGIAQMDSLGVAGSLRGTALHVVTWLPVVTILCLPVGIGLIVLAAKRPSVPIR